MEAADHRAFRPELGWQPVLRRVGQDVGDEVSGLLVLGQRRPQSVGDVLAAVGRREQAGDPPAELVGGRADQALQVGQDGPGRFQQPRSSPHTLSSIWIR